MDNKEIDRQIAKKVMGWKDLDFLGFWSPSTNIAHAFEVVERMKKLSWYLNGLHALEGHDVDWEAVFERDGDIEFADADTPAMAISLAALETIKEA